MLSRGHQFKALSRSSCLFFRFGHGFQRSQCRHITVTWLKKKGGGGFDSAMVFKQEVSVTVRVTLFGRHVESMMRAPTRFLLRPCV
jgi:hypothetical protein